MTAPTDLIRRYFALAPGTDPDAYVALFADDAVVEDEGAERRGLAEIRAWRIEVPSVTYTVRSVISADSGNTAVAEIVGDFPGSPVDLTYVFRFDDSGRITSLSIRP